ncbi:molybdopterin molybdotransferase MoeA [Methanogenium marinum]|uniref:Molybdopterin molybdotransferase MoeA n=1 Tax=Methanogenium marinum TaxID=348610 RepID=A0A9Q4PYG4_9EURY|nr:gephyrin-like molybdotransferase Glp [Methanogenium marinum]MDE4907917.1 molybdopterin molybdotransferase MoeA [Methanogenium marinum]
MSIFLELIPVSEAEEILRKIAPSMEEEAVPLQDAYDRVLSRSATAEEDIPGFTRTVVDGYAIRAADTIGAGEAMPAMLTITGRVGMGEGDAGHVAPGECRYVPTGAVIPDGADAAAMIEYAEESGNEVLVYRAVASGENLTLRGDDFQKNDLVFPAGRRLSSRDLGVMGALGITTVPVRRKPVIGIISTGNELISPDKTPGPGEIRDVNTYLCRGYAQTRGLIPRIYGIIPDERDPLEEAIRQAVAECDLVCISGGSSKGERDMCAAILADLGTVHAHGISLAPGKPTIIGTIDDVPVMGLPGHPASAYVVLVALCDVLIAAMTGSEVTRITVPARCASPIPSARGREDYIRVRLEGRDAYPLFGKSGLTNTLIESSGLLRIPDGREGYEKGAEVEVILW